MTTPCSPIDNTHRESVAYVGELRARLTKILLQVGAWEPSTCPPHWKPEPGDPNIPAYVKGLS